jgi:hypothetical protein
MNAVTRAEYTKLKREQEQTQHERKLEEAERRKKQEEAWTQKMEQIRAEEESRKRQERTQIKLQKVFGSEGDILLLSPRLQRLDALSSPRQRETNESESEKQTKDVSSASAATKSKTSSGDNRELKSSGEKRSKAFSVVREERAFSADSSGEHAGYSRQPPPVPSRLTKPSRSGEIASMVSGESEHQGATRKWLKKKNSLPRSLDKVASEYKEQRLLQQHQHQQHEEETDGDDEDASTLTAVTSDEVGDTASSADDALPVPEEAAAETDEWESAAAGDEGQRSRRQQVSASTAFMNDMNYLAPELAMRAEEARKKRMRGRNAVSLDRS